MKKLLLVAALGVAGLVSANEVIAKAKVKEGGLKVDQKTKKNIKSSKNIDPGDNCIKITTSCGEPLWYCGDGKTTDNIQELKNADETIFCGGNYCMRNVMKFVVFLLFVMPLLIYSQEKGDGFSGNLNASLVYEYSYIKDSTNVQSKKIEYFHLKILDKFTLFVSEKNIKRDSLSQRLIKNFEQKKSSSFDLTGYPLSDFKFYLLKYPSENKFKIYQKFERQFYFYTEEELPIWNLKSEVVKIGDLNCHKAETFYRGRKWIAWYTTDVPIIAGPYKFSNLPGMVVQLENLTDTLSFNLVSYKIGSKSEDVFLPENMILSAKEIKRKEFLILEQSAKENMILKAKNLGLGFSAEQEKSYRDKIKRDNNPIELK